MSIELFDVSGLLHLRSPLLGIQPWEHLQAGSSLLFTEQLRYHLFPEASNQLTCSCLYPTVLRYLLYSPDLFKLSCLLVCCWSNLPSPAPLERSLRRVELCFVYSQYYVPHPEQRLAHSMCSKTMCVIANEFSRNQNNCNNYNLNNCNRQTGKHMLCALKRNSNVFQL